MVKLYGFCLSIAYIARLRHPTLRVYQLSDVQCAKSLVAGVVKCGLAVSMVGT